ncbi:MAG: hypothetical protein CMM39_00740 [Rhodospirillaceae bacterium]|nr:hypothetical protein [Rhodospirillaceae bacterium]
MPQRVFKQQHNGSSLSQLLLSLFLLLLAFFVFLNSISSYEEKKSYDVAKSVRAHFPNLMSQGENNNVSGKNKNNEIEPDTLKLIEDAYQLILPNMKLEKVNQSESVEISVPMQSLFNGSSGLPNKNAPVFLRNIAEILKQKGDTYRLAMEIFFSYDPSSKGVKLDDRMQSKLIFLIETLIHANAPKGYVSIGLEPRDTKHIRFKISTRSKNGRLNRLDFP